MTKDEALKLALEAFESFYEHGYYRNECFDHITAIKVALAQPEQDGKCKYCTDGCPACDARKLPEQERFLVATIGNWGRVEWVDGVFPSLGDKMYSAPRTWVGLTDDEIFEIHKQVDSMQYLTFGHAIEAKLKEKNT